MASAVPGVGVNVAPRGPERGEGGLQRGSVPRLSTTLPRISAETPAIC